MVVQSCNSAGLPQRPHFDHGTEMFHTWNDAEDFAAVLAVGLQMTLTLIADTFVPFQFDFAMTLTGGTPGWSPWSNGRENNAPF